MDSNTKNPLFKEQIVRSSIWGHHFIFLNCFLAIFIGFAYLYGAPATTSFVSFMYMLLTWLGQMSFLCFLAFLILFFPLSFIGNFKLYRLISVVIAVILFTILLVDVKLFLSIKVHLSWMVISLMLRDLDFNTGLNFNFMIIALPIIIGIEVLFAKLATKEIYRRSLRHNFFPMITLIVVVCSFIISHGIYIWADAYHYEKITSLRSVFPAHYPMTARTFLSNHGILDTSKIEDASEFKINYPLEKIQTIPLSSKRNIITIFINGMSYADLSDKNTPVLMNLKRENTSYENHYLPYQTLRDNMFAGTYGLPVFYRDEFERKDVEPVNLALLLHSEYLFRVFTSSATQQQLTNDASKFGLNKDKIIASKDDAQSFAKAKEFLDKLHSEQNFVVTINSDNLVGELNQLTYSKKLKDLDDQIASLVEYLQQKDLLKNTLVIITSSLGNATVGSQNSVYSRSRQHVPFIAIWPDNTLKGVAENILTTHFDLVPTFAIEILGVTTPCVKYSIGSSLRSGDNRDYIISSSGNSLLVISKDAVRVYRSNGRAYIDDEGKRTDIKPNLETLIRAISDINRFHG
ncbi:MAG: DUF3413 domain-containing protein [Succinivibrio sp.]